MADSLSERYNYDASEAFNYATYPVSRWSRVPSEPTVAYLLFYFISFVNEFG